MSLNGVQRRSAGYSVAKGDCRQTLDLDVASQELMLWDRSSLLGSAFPTACGDLRLSIEGSRPQATGERVAFPSTPLPRRCKTTRGREASDPLSSPRRRQPRAPLEARSARKPYTPSGCAATSARGKEPPKRGQTPPPFAAGIGQRQSRPWLRARAKTHASGLARAAATVCAIARSRRRTPQAAAVPSGRMEAPPWPSPAAALARRRLPAWRRS